MKSSEIFLAMVIVVLSIIIMTDKCGNLKEGSQDYKYKTDTLIVEVPFEVKKTDTIKTPPIRIRIYEIDSIPFEVSVIPDSLFILLENLEDSLEEYRISNFFLTQFPTASKLISADLTRDSLDITTLDIMGQVETRTYPMYYNRYNYQWYDNQLYRDDRDKEYNEKDKDKWKQLYLEGGYDLLSKEPLLEINYQRAISPRIRLTGASQLRIKTNPTLSGEIKLGYRLLD